MLLAITYRAVADLKPYARNARTHSRKQVKQIAAAIKEFGFTNPVLIDESDQIIAGHGRVAAAKLLGLAEVPTLQLSHLCPTQKRAYILADNRLAEKGNARTNKIVRNLSPPIGGRRARSNDDRTAHQIH
ncbi:MAG: hypothetical protein QOJ84_2390 [Bradyrhizobium sp.]|jgi:ParB-like chromosome segregation protein Spo0J|nr:hypothetical protein [Bradyrhizobium sp.]